MNLKRLTTRCLSSFDIDYPLDVDDEYWPMGEVESSAEFAANFVQPECIHSAMSYFVIALRLIRVLGVATQSFVSLTWLHFGQKR